MSVLESRMAVLPRLEMGVGDLVHRHPDGHRRQADRLIGQGHVAVELDVCTISKSTTARQTARPRSKSGTPRAT